MPPRSTSSPAPPGRGLHSTTLHLLVTATLTLLQLLLVCIVSSRFALSVSVAAAASSPGPPPSHRSPATGLAAFAEQAPPPHSSPMQQPPSPVMDPVCGLSISIHFPAHSVPKMPLSPASPPPPVTFLQALIDLGNCNHVVSQDPLTGTYLCYFHPPPL